MNFTAYKSMSKKLFESNLENADFAHLYLILEWNLLAGNNNCKNLNVKQIK